jgi:hypothetical protein
MSTKPKCLNNPRDPKEPQIKMLENPQGPEMIQKPNAWITLGTQKSPKLKCLKIHRDPKW